MSKARALSIGLFDNDLIVKHLPSKFKTALINGLLFGGVRGTDTVVSGTPPLTLEDAVQAALVYLRQFGIVEQNGTPTPSSPVDIKCNNGTLTVKDEELPYGYRRIESITFNGNTYYETNEKLYGSDIVTMTIAPNTTSGQNLFGCYSGTGDDDINFSLYVYGTSSGQAYWRYGKTLYRPVLGGTTQRTISFGAGGTTGFATNVSYAETEFETTSTARIGALPNSSSAKFSGTIYGNITIGNRLKYIPCVRLSDGWVGYYETVKGVFLEPQGSIPVAGAYDNEHLVQYVAGTPEVISIGVATTAYKMEFALDYMGDPEDDGFFELTFKPAEDWTFECGEFTGGTIIVPKGESITFAIPTNEDGSVYSIQIYRDGQHIGEDPQFNNPIYVTEYVINHVDPGTDPTKAVTITEVPFVEGQTASAESLLAVGDHQDEQEIITGSVTRKCKVYIFDGTEAWTLPSGADYFRLDGMFEDAIPYASDSPAIVCSHFVGRTPKTSASGMVDGDIKLGYTSTYNRLYLKYAAMATADDLKAWFASQYAAGTPVIMIYPLATETTETVDPQTLSTTAGDNTITVTAEVDNIPLEVKYKKGN